VIVDLIKGAGAASVEVVLGAGHALDVLWKAGRRLFKPKHAAREFRAMVLQMHDHGVKAMPVVSLVAVFTGMIVAIQAGVEIKSFGQESLVGNIVAASMFREMGPFMTAMILTASVGAGMAAEIGTMAVSEELDGLECLSIDPVSFLCLPRILALALMAPLLTFVGNVLAVLGGAIVCRTQLSVPAGIYFRNVVDSLRADPDSPFGVLPEEILSGALQALVFAIIIATVSCASGLRASGGAIGVGRAVRGAVVNCFLLIMVVGYYMSWLLFR